MDKKKLNILLYLPLYILLSSIFLFIFSANSYASISYDTLKTAIDNVAEKRNFSNYGYKGEYPNYEDVENYLQTYTSFLITTRQNNYGSFIIFWGNQLYVYDTIGGNDRVGTIYSNSDTHSLVQTSYDWTDKTFRNVTTGYPVCDNLLLNYGSIYGDIYSNNTFSTVKYYSNIEEVPINSITLTATKSGSKFSFTDKSQLQVNLTGDYTIGDFRFYVQRYVDNEWQNFSDINDYYILNNYENPYYIFWSNLNYYPVGTYRYMAEYQGENAFSTVSNDFEITSSVIENSGTATGTINPDSGNVNVDVNIDTGNTVDNIKDYLGEEPENTNGDIENSITDIQGNLENELENSEIVSTLQLAEKGFLELLKEPEKDFKIEWNDIYYQDVVLIPAGSINFSKMCRDNEALGKVKQYINIIVSFGLAYGIIKYLYNLFLATLGIDNQLLYEQPEETTSFTADASAGTVTYRTRTKNGNTVIHKGSMKGKES